MIYTAPCIMFWMRAYPLRGQVGGGWALEIESFWGPMKWPNKLVLRHLLRVSNFSVNSFYSVSRRERFPKPIIQKVG
jgi:hypothetical protein